MKFKIGDKVKVIDKKKYDFPLYNILDKISPGDLREILNKYLAYCCIDGTFDFSYTSLSKKAISFEENMHPKRNKFLKRKVK
jgi:hypothetical protein